MKEAVIFTDGASKGNPGPGGWAAIVASDERAVEFGGREERTTNNRMELRAVTEALRFARSLASKSITLYSDSAYAINSATKWMRGWERDGWQTKNKQKVLNRDLWQALAAEIRANPKISWVKVGGHIDIPGNERADEIASDFAENKKVYLYDGPRVGYSVDLVHTSPSKAKHAQKNAERSRSKQKAYSYVSRVDGRIFVDRSWDDCKKRVEGKRALYRKSLSPEDEAGIVRSFSSKQ